ncbi:MULTISPECIES: extensin-like domain-containing protein [unclassified Rhizobium]|uniref:extensin-like domain-containing protein n=1 Tax=unclassified Rhizobium TaxID=2613769 RepID=UPI001783011D|nr:MULTISPECIES: extensin family protein [unclassified Rhizobium]MBD8686789.1 extensin family protein [Rhizobium sp. CFBP 13644]MBD8691408.1 extensin family protein [Rhizobium sp. CFBP 13717]
MLFRLMIIAASGLLISASQPPQDVPVPQPKPEQQDAAPAAAPTASPTEKKAEDAPVPPPAESTVPKPEEKPEPSAKPDEPKKEDEKKPEEPPRDPVKAENPEELKACLTELKELGAQFKELPPIPGEEDGCGIASPLELSVVIPGIKLEPEGTMRCEAALALSRWAKNVVVPTAKIALPDRSVTAFGNASTYICRNRNSASTGKISEHAKGSAVDIATLTFDKGEPLVMKPRGEDGTMEGAFQRTITTAACLFFRTVLSPGSDATHQDHLHMDVLERKGGYLYCR